MRGLGRLLLLVVFGIAGLGLAVPARAHIGNKDVFQQVNAGPYKLFVTIRTPTVIPGVATVEVRASGAPVGAMRITPLPLTGEAAKHPPSSDAMKASGADPAFFTGSLWLMAAGSWQVRFEVDGAAGHATASVPVPAVPLSILKMQRPLGMMLGMLGLILALGMAGIVAAAVRESRLEPGVQPDPNRRRRALIASGITAVLVALTIYAGGKWWNIEAASFAADVYRPLSLVPSLSGNTLELKIGTYDPGPKRRFRTRSNTDLLPDHGHVMHLYAIRQPEMDAVFHLHPEPVADGEYGITIPSATAGKSEGYAQVVNARAGAGVLHMTLPPMPAGEYRLYADIVHANGFPETLTAMLTVPPNLVAEPLAPEDASAVPPALSAGELGTAYKLPDGYTMVWERPGELRAGMAYTLRFRLLDPSGKPAGDMRPYLGMPGHAAFVKADWTTFAHTHPEGSAAMQAVMLAKGASPEIGSMGGGMAGMDMSGAASEAIGPEVEFPYGFPSAGRYRVFIQMKHGGTVETGVFDAEVR